MATTKPVCPVCNGSGEFTLYPNQKPNIDLDVWLRAEREGWTHEDAVRVWCQVEQEAKDSGADATALVLAPPPHCTHCGGSGENWI